MWYPNRHRGLTGSVNVDHTVHNVTCATGVGYANNIIEGDGVLMGCTGDNTRGNYLTMGYLTNIPYYGRELIMTRIGHNDLYDLTESFDFGKIFKL